MTATMNRPVTDEEIADLTATTEQIEELLQPVPTPEPETPVAEVTTVPTEREFRIGEGDTAVVIHAVDERQALKKYKRLVRAEGIKASQAMGWCESGTNERLARLGLRGRSEGFPVRVTVTAERVVYISLDADDATEAAEILAHETEADLLNQATATVGRGWTAVRVEALEEIRTTPYQVGEPDDTTSGMRAQGIAAPASCSNYHEGYYCTLPVGHRGRQHAAGNGNTITAVWTRRRTPNEVAAEGR
jgi:hypothetical protein